MSVVDDYAYIPTAWRAKAGGPDEDGVPTSYYSAVQLTCHAEIVDDSQRKAELLRRQLGHFQPQGNHARVAVDMPPYGRMLSGIRGLRLRITSVAATFKYDDHNPQEHRARARQRVGPGVGLHAPGSAGESISSCPIRSVTAARRAQFTQTPRAGPVLSCASAGEPVYCFGLAKAHDRPVGRFLLHDGPKTVLSN